MESNCLGAVTMTSPLVRLPGGEGSAVVVHQLISWQRLLRRLPCVTAAGAKYHQHFLPACYLNSCESHTSEPWWVTSSESQDSLAFGNGIRLVKAIVIEWGVVSPVCWESLDGSCFRRCSQNSFICMLHVVIVSVYLPWWSVVRTVFMYGSWHLLCLLHHRVQQQLLQLSRSSQFSCQAIFQRCHVPLRGCDWQPL